jgi:uncharacterized protein with HEPN domain
VIDSRLRDYLDHKADAARQSIEYLSEMQKDEFLTERKTQQAVIFNLIVLGEAATKVINDFPEFAMKNQSIPWTSMKGMRNRVAHGYFDIDMGIVWETVVKDLPPLLENLSQIHDE